MAVATAAVVAVEHAEVSADAVAPAHQQDKALVPVLARTPGLTRVDLPVAVAAQDQVAAVRLRVRLVVAAESPLRDASRSGPSVKSSSRCRRHHWVASRCHAATVRPLSGCVAAPRSQTSPTRSMQTQQAW